MARWLPRIRKGAPDTPSNPRRLTTDPCNKVRVESNRQGRIHFDHSPFADLRGSQQRGGPCPIFRVRGRVTMRLPSRRCCGGGILTERTERGGFDRGRGLNPDLWTLYGEPYPGA